MTEQEKVSSMRRMIRVMYAVGQTGGEWFTLTSMMRKMSLKPGTMHRYLHVLVEEQMLEQDADTQRYRLAPKLKNLLIVQGLRLVYAPTNEEETAS